MFRLLSLPGGVWEHSWLYSQPDIYHGPVLCEMSSDLNQASPVCPVYHIELLVYNADHDECHGW